MINRFSSGGSVSSRKRIESCSDLLSTVGKEQSNRLSDSPEASDRAAIQIPRSHGASGIRVSRVSIVADGPCSGGIDGDAKGEPTSDNAQDSWKTWRQRNQIGLAEMDALVRKKASKKFNQRQQSHWLELSNRVKQQMQEWQPKTQSTAYTIALLASLTQWRIDTGGRYQRLKKTRLESRVKRETQPETKHQSSSAVSATASLPSKRPIPASDIGMVESSMTEL